MSRTLRFRGYRGVPAGGFVVSQGGTKGLDFVHEDALGVVGGVAQSTDANTLDRGNINVEAVSDWTTLFGPVKGRKGYALEYTITNFGFTRSYRVSSDYGDISIARDKITFVPKFGGWVSFKVNGREFDVQIGTEDVQKPRINKVAYSIEGGGTLTFGLTPFRVFVGSDILYSSSIQVSRQADFAGTALLDQKKSSGNMLSYSVAGFSDTVPIYGRAIYEGLEKGQTEWGLTRSYRRPFVVTGTLPGTSGTTVVTPVTLNIPTGGEITLKTDNGYEQKFTASTTAQLPIGATTLTAIGKGTDGGQQWIPPVPGIPQQGLPEYPNGIQAIGLAYVYGTRVLDDFIISSPDDDRIKSRPEWFFDTGAMKFAIVPVSFDYWYTNAAQGNASGVYVYNFTVDIYTKNQGSSFWSKSERKTIKTASSGGTLNIQYSQGASNAAGTTYYGSCGLVKNGNSFDAYLKYTATLYGLMFQIKESDVVGPNAGVGDTVREVGIGYGGSYSALPLGKGSTAPNSEMYLSDVKPLRSVNPPDFSNTWNPDYPNGLPPYVPATSETPGYYVDTNGDPSSLTALNQTLTFPGGSRQWVPAVPAQPAQGEPGWPNGLPPYGKVIDYDTIVVAGNGSAGGGTAWYSKELLIRGQNANGYSDDGKGYNVLSTLRSASVDVYPGHVFLGGGSLSLTWEGFDPQKMQFAKASGTISLAGETANPDNGERSYWQASSSCDISVVGYAEKWVGFPQYPNGLPPYKPAVPAKDGYYTGLEAVLSTRQMYLVIDDTPNGGFGAAASMSGDGKFFALGTPAGTVNSGKVSGSVAIFENMLDQPPVLRRRFYADPTPDTLTLTVPSGGQIRIKTDTGFDQTYQGPVTAGQTSSYTVTPPANTKVTTLIGKGAPGSTFNNPGQEYIAPSGPIQSCYTVPGAVTWQWLNWGEQSASLVGMYDASTYGPTSASPPAMPPGTDPKYGGTFYSIHYENRSGGAWQVTTAWSYAQVGSPDQTVCTITGYQNPGQPYIAPSTSYTTGEPVKVNYRGNVITFAGGYGGPASETTQEITANLSTSLGRSLFMTSSAGYIFAGAPNEYNTIDNAGAMFELIHNSDGTWTIGDKILSPTPTNNALFGYQVTSSQNGNRVFISAMGENAVYYFERVNNKLTFKQKIQATDTPSTGSFGENLGCTADGTVLVVGAPKKANGSNTGAVYVFKNVNGTFEQSRKLSPVCGATTFSYEVIGDAELTIDQYNVSNTLVKTTKLTSATPTGTFTLETATRLIKVRGRGTSTGNTSEAKITYDGVDYLFPRSLAGTPYERFLDIPVVSSIKDFGQDVDISEDGTVIWASSPKSSSAFAEQGVVHPYRLVMGEWKESPRLVSAEPVANGNFGFRIETNANGNRTVIGDPGGHGGVGMLCMVTFETPESGSTYGDLDVFNTVYVTTSSLNNFGREVAISSDGLVQLASNPAMDNNRGAAYLFNAS